MSNDNNNNNASGGIKNSLMCSGSIFARITVPLCLLMAVSVFLVGVLIGPLWLVCIGVAIAIATMVCTMYLYAMARKAYNEQHGSQSILETSSLDSASNADDDYYGNLSIAMRRYVFNLKLPSYAETVRRTDSGRIIECQMPPDYTEIYPPAYV
uniref:Uncharacterized protein n=1 Tax=Clytia hemisphaerica TaxID=252671 RepID=A0A7M5X7F9_9CNID